MKKSCKGSGLRFKEYPLPGIGPYCEVCLTVYPTRTWKLVPGDRVPLHKQNRKE